MRELVIVGTGELAKEVVWLIEEINKVTSKYLIRGFLGREAECVGNEFFGYRIIGNEKWLLNQSQSAMISAVIAIQDPLIRSEILERSRIDTKWETLIHPSAVIASTASIGKGSIIFPFSSISVDTKIGDFCLCYLNSTISNDCKIGNFVSIMSSAQISEHVIIGDRCSLGASSCIYPGVEMGNDVKVSSGAVVDRNCDNSEKISGRNGFHFFK